MDIHTPRRELSLFAGAGGGLLSSKWLLGHRIVCYVEWDKYRQQVIQARITDGLLDDAPIWDDVTSFDGKPWRGCVDIVTAGFPCPPFSVAGKRLGGADSRNKWPDTIRIIREVRPAVAFLENVPGLLSSGYFGRVLGELAEAGYDAEWGVFSAAEVGAPHKRERVFILAYAEGQQDRGLCEQGLQPDARAGGEDVAHADDLREQQSQGSIAKKRGWPNNGCEDVADTDATGLAVGQEQELLGQCKAPERSGLRDPTSTGLSYWTSEEAGQPSPLTELERPSGREVERDFRGVPYVVAHRVDRLKALGDGQVSLTMAYAYATLFERAFGHRPALACGG